MSELREAMRERMKTLGWSGRKLAREAGVAMDTVNRYLSGANPKTHRVTLIVLCQTLGLDWDWSKSDSLTQAPQMNEAPVPPALSVSDALKARRSV
jgi:transcriptional regulator with XRE-family HTH domain